MFEKPKTSFIPKKSKPKKKKAISLFLLLSVIIFLTAVGASVAVFLYDLGLKKSIDVSKESIKREEANLDIDTIKEISRLDSRLQSVRQILGNHVAPSAIFELFERNTVKSISFDNFNYSIDDEAIMIEMSGKALDYAAVVRQSDIFTENNYIKNPVFSDLRSDSDGNKTFNFSCVIDPDFISYPKIATEGVPLD